ncbi:hypothetical protein M2323_004014 [Rhodoblastus acidophilus]|nr:hypothetical protein [Rhodoblastus acidophilus]MCW2335070.1 hypothetical protein [Rhodoblastus acidophilus]
MRLSDGDILHADKGCGAELLLAPLYRNSNAIDRMFCRLKDFRRMATRYDRKAVNFLATVCFAATSQLLGIPPVKHAGGPAELEDDAQAASACLLWGRQFHGTNQSLKCRGRIIRSMLQSEGGIARQMRQACLVALAMRLLSRIAFRDPHLGSVAPHRLFHDASGAGIIGLMHHGVLAVEDPMISVRSLNPDAGLVAGHFARGAKDRLGLFNLDFETRVGADEHVTQRALADAKPERVAENEAQPLIGQRLETLIMHGERMDARPERRCGGDRRRRTFRLRAAMLAAAGEAPVADDMGVTGGMSISSYSPINSRSASADTAPPQNAQCVGR